KAAEHTLLGWLGFSLELPTALVFASALLRVVERAAASGDAPITFDSAARLDAASFLLLLASHDYETLRFPPSLLGAAVALLAV
ncbi:hypothetical protein OH407_24630, partial [Salmonella enterica]|uniref:hypothetical protein n=1 Tax=Salmonella enterica TaxID=28901 RepID=UPI0022B65706